MEVSAMNVETCSRCYAGVFHFGVDTFGEPSCWWNRAGRTALGLTVAGTLGCATIVGARPMSTSSPQRTTFHVLGVGQQRRGFLLHRPSATIVRPLPVLIVLHGTSANANVVMDESGMNAIADSIGALVVYPNGTGGIPYIRLFWNTEHCCGGAMGQGADEPGLVRAIIDSLDRRFPIDRSRVGVIGFSDAGSLAYSLACDAFETITAIGVIAGELPPTPCTPARGVSTLVFHGTADGNIRYGRTAEHVAEWAARQRCAGGRTTSTDALVHTAFRACNDASETELYTIVGGRHGWPGGRRSSWLAPRPPRSIDASRVFARFVMDHPRSTP